jgi:hypothetical protein
MIGSDWAYSWYKRMAASLWRRKFSVRKVMVSIAVSEAGCSLYTETAA